MASKAKRSTTTRRRAQTQSKLDAQVTQVVDRSVAEGQRFANAWAAAMTVSVKAWADMMRASAEATSQAAQAFGDELKKGGGR